MNKRTFKRIQMLYEEGISLNMAIQSIVDLCTNSAEASETIIEFYKEIFPLGSRPHPKHIAGWRSYKEAENDLNSS